MTAAIEALLDSLGGFRENDYLRFLASRVPLSLKEELLSDGAPDLELSSRLGDGLSVDDLLCPLFAAEFKAAWASEGRSEAISLANYILIGYGHREGQEATAINPFKVIYVASLYLAAFAADEFVSGDSGEMRAIALFTEAGLATDAECRIHLLSFCFLWR